MSPQTPNWKNPKVALAVAIAAALILGLLPARSVRWVSWFGNVADLLVAPVQHPFSAAVRALRSPPSPDAVDAEAVQTLRQDLQEALLLYHRVRDENERLRAQILDLQRGLALAHDLPVRQIAAPVIGGSSDLSTRMLRVRAGRRDGVEFNAVAVVRGVHLVGKAVEVSPRISKVLPITDRAAGRIHGVVMLDELTPGPLGSFEPLGDGALRGRLEFTLDPEAAQPRIAAGATVRLSDDQWPEHAQMLVIGAVEAIEPAPEQPARQIVTVRPAVRLDRVSEVVLRFLGEADQPQRAGGGGP